VAAAGVRLGSTDSVAAREVGCGDANENSIQQFVDIYANQDDRPASARVLLRRSGQEATMKSILLRSLLIAAVALMPFVLTACEWPVCSLQC
jgi:hypothetical protein